MTIHQTYLAVASDMDTLRDTPGFIAVRNYQPGRHLRGEVGCVENCRFLVDFDPTLCKSEAAGHTVRAHILPAVKGGRIYTLEQDV